MGSGLQDAESVRLIDQCVGQQVGKEAAAQAWRGVLIGLGEVDAQLVQAAHGGGRGGVGAIGQGLVMRGLHLAERE